MAQIIRTPTRAAGGITPAEKTKLDAHAALWISRAFRTKPIDRERITAAILGLYRAAGLKDPRVVVVPSPLVMAAAYGASAAIWHKRSATRSATRDATDNATRNATDNATRNATHNATASATRDATASPTASATRDATASATYNATYNATRNATYNATDNATDNATRNATDSATRNATRSATYIAMYDATRSAMYDAMYDATDIATRSATHNATRNATRSATYIAMYDATRSAMYDATDIATDIATRSATASATRSATASATRSAMYDATDSATDIATRNATDIATRNATDIATRNATASATDSATYNAMYDATASATRSATASATRSATASATRSAMYDATDSATDIATRNATTEDLERGALRACYDLAGTPGIECARRWSSVYQGGNMWAAYDCYLTAIRDVLDLRLPEHNAYQYWESAAIEGAFRVLHPEFCMISDFPEIIKIDDQNRPHCSDGPSHKWRDGWSLYHWHGVRVPERWITHPELLTASTAFSEQNLELRRAACEIIGWKKILEELQAIVIDDDGDPEIGSLLQVTLPGTDVENISARFLRVRCGTGRDFAICVDPTCNTAIEAQAWMLGLPAKDFKRPEVRT